MLLGTSIYSSNHVQGQLHTSVYYVQVAQGREHSSMQSVRKSSLHLDQVKMQPSPGANEFLQLPNEHDMLPPQQDAAMHDSIRVNGLEIVEPQPQVLQRCQAFQVSAICVFGKLLLRELLPIAAVHKIELCIHDITCVNAYVTASTATKCRA